MPVSPLFMLGAVVATLSALAFVVTFVAMLGETEPDVSWFSVPWNGLIAGLMLMALGSLREIKTELRRLRDENSER